jgi:plasmid stabilization system protein ParE
MAHKLTYRPHAAEDLEAIYRIIAQDKPTSAFGFIEKIQRRCDLLRFSLE